MEENHDNRRYFRVDLVKDIQGSARISSINHRQIEEEKTIPISLLDLSAGGMRVKMPYNLPTEIIILNVKFEFENEQYNLRAQVIRKMLKDNGYEYGLKFLTLEDQMRMIRCLNMYNIKNAKFKRVELDLRAKKYISSFVKILELIDEPTYLITDNRIVVSANHAAQEKGVNLGERCYKTICHQKRSCSFCILESCIKKDQIFESAAIILGKECTARWLYTEDGLIIHYFKTI